MLALTRRFLAPYRVQLIYVVVLLLAQAFANLYLPDLNANIINNGIAKGDTAYILGEGIKMVLVTLLMGVAAVAGVYHGSKTAMAMGRDVRGAVFRTVETFSQSEVDRFGAPSLITRNTNDVQQVQMVVQMMLNMMISAPIMMVGGVIMALRQDVRLSSMIAVILPLMAVLIGAVMWKTAPIFRSMQLKVDRVNQVMREKLAGVRVIRAFVRTRHEEERFDEANLDLTQTQLTINRIMAVMMPLLMAIFNFSSVAILWLGAQRVDAGMPIGNLTAFLAYIMQILMSVMMAVFMFVMVPRAMASAARINEVLETEPSVRDPARPVEPTGACACVELRDVGFRYPGAEDAVLCSVSFRAVAGEITAVVGSTGSGKSTLVNLIPRFYDVTSGAVLVDGVDVRQSNREELWAKIGLVPQRSFLFAGTVADNLRYGKPDATDEELWHALEVAQAADFVSQMPEGLDAQVSQGGANFSGGQRQRLAIARAIVRQPEVLILDDSFSALDFKTDAQLRAALKTQVTGTTVIVVAQRVSTIMRADRIIVLEGGRVAGIGTHAELMATCETYREIVYSQLTQEEVA